MSTFEQDAGNAAGDAAAAVGKQADDLVGTLTSHIQGQDELLAQKNRRIIRQRNTITELREQLAQYTARTPLIGSSAYPGNEEGFVALERLVGKALPIRRSYKGPGAMPTFAQSDVAHDVGKRLSYWSFKFDSDNGFESWPKWAAGRWDTWFEDFLMAWPLNCAPFPTDIDGIVSPPHEPDGGDGKEADGDPDVFLAGFARFTPIIRRVNQWRVEQGGKPILWGPTLMRGSLVYRPHDIDEWAPPPEQVDFYGIDGYGEGVPTLSWQNLFDPVFAWAAARGRPIAVAETGPWNYAPGDRAEWVRDAVVDAKAEIVAGRLVAWCYWNSGQNSLTSEDAPALAG